MHGCDEEIHEKSSSDAHQSTCMGACLPTWFIIEIYPFRIVACMVQMAQWFFPPTALLLSIALPCALSCFCPVHLVVMCYWSVYWVSAGAGTFSNFGEQSK